MRTRIQILTAAVLPLMLVLVSIAPGDAGAITTNFLSAQIIGLKTQILRINGVDIAQWGTITRVQDDLANLLSRVGLDELTLASLGTRTDQLETATSDLEQQLGSARDADAALASRLGAVEASHAALAATVGALSGTGTPEEFWPQFEISVEPTVSAAWYNVDPLLNGAGSYLRAGATLQMTDTVTGQPFFPAEYDAYMRVTFRGETVASPVTDIPIGTYDDTPATIPSGTPVTIEYWVEVYGRRLHGSKTVSDWVWERH